MRLQWWKILGIVLVLYSLIYGLLMDVPRLPILNESIRNLYYHVTQWFAMMILLTASLVYSIKNLSSGKPKDDQLAVQLVNVGLLFGAMGLVTGMVWAQFTWGAFWVNDPKLNGTAVGMLIYIAYLILRGSIDDEIRRAKVAGVFNIFAYVMFMLFIMILPRINDSLHPGNGGNPAFSSYDLNQQMRYVFYPAIIGWTLIGVWLVQLNYRLWNAKNTLDEK